MAIKIPDGDSPMDELTGFLGIRYPVISAAHVHGTMPVSSGLLAPNGFLHAGSIVTLADTCCGNGCIANLPDGAVGFTTIELKSNHTGTARDGHIECHAKPVHSGRTTQVWDAVVRHVESGKTLALFRCTQMVIYPR